MNSINPDIKIIITSLIRMLKFSRAQVTNLAGFMSDEEFDKIAKECASCPRKVSNFTAKRLVDTFNSYAPDNNLDATDLADILEICTCYVEQVLQDIKDEKSEEYIKNLVYELKEKDKCIIEANIRIQHQEERAIISLPNKYFVVHKYREPYLSKVETIVSLIKMYNTLIPHNKLTSSDFSKFLEVPEQLVNAAIKVMNQDELKSKLIAKIEANIKESEDKHNCQPKGSKEESRIYKANARLLEEKICKYFPGKKDIDYSKLNYDQLLEILEITACLK
jgi:hypothetical protein